MADVTPTPSGPDKTQSGLRSLAILCYVLYLLAPINGLTAIAGVIIAYIKRDDARGTIWAGHFDNLILVFWVALIVSAVAMASFFASLGGVLAIWPVLHPGLPFVALLFVSLLLMPVFAIWFLYRMIKGLIRAGEERPY